MSKLQELEQKITAELQAAATIEAVEAARVRALGKKGRVSELLKSLGAMSAAERQEKGPLFNGLKLRLQAAVEARRAALRQALTAQRLETERVDVTLPVRPSPAEEGRLHPISQVIDEATAIFASMGFTIAEGPDIETEYYNFTALNFPESHPAREMHDTFFMRAADNEKDKAKQTEAQARAAEKSKRHKTAAECAPGGNGDAPPHNHAAKERMSAHKKVLRTHTSPGQIRTMEKTQPPLRIIIPGKTYRMDSDATHSPMFHQLEGLVVDKSANIAQMMWVLERFCARFFEVPAVKMRFRPSFFPFTEPSMEVDIQCERGNDGVKFGRGADWLEVLGCGMVHPNVLRAGGLDPEEYQGFAWGMGLDRLAMLKYGMPDLRAFFETDLRWLRHYGFRLPDMPALLGNFAAACAG